MTPDSQELIADSDFRIIHARRYGLIGRNGVGKTTLLRMIASYQIKGFPLYVKMMHVEQEVEGNDLNVIDFVMNADLERSMLLHEEKKIMDEAKQKGVTIDVESVKQRVQKSEQKKRKERGK